MLIKFYKAKSFWKQSYASNKGDYTDYARHPQFIDELYESFKEEISNIHSGDLKEWNGKQVFIFQKFENKDFKGRIIPTTIALYAEHQFINPVEVSRILTVKIDNMYDDTWKYEIDIDKTMMGEKWIITKAKGIQSNNRWLVILVTLILLIVGSFIFKNNGNNMQKQQLVPEEEKSQSIELITSQQSVSETTQAVKENKWKWDDFCQEHTMHEEVSFCYQEYIKIKCDIRFKFRQGYLDYAKDNSQGICYVSSKYKKIKQDTDLQNYIMRNKITKKNLKFFEGEK